MKKAARLLTLVVGSLLLAACQVPDKVEQFWREKFFLHVSPEQIQQYLGPILSLLALAAFISALIALAIEMARGKVMGPGFITSALLMFSIAVVFLFIDFTTAIGERALPSELTLDAILKAMHWELSPDLGKMASASWGVTLTYLIPLIVSRWQIVMLIEAVFALAWSIIGRSLKGIAFIVGSVLGWAMFLVLFNAIVQFFGSNYPDWSFGPVAILVNLFYTGILVTTLFFCYFWIPLIAAILAPDLREEVATSTNTVAGERPKRDWSGILIPYSSGGSNPSPNGNGRTPQAPVPENGPGYEEGNFREVPSPQITPGFPELPSGFVPDNGNGGGSGGSGSPKGTQPNGNGASTSPPIPDVESGQWSSAKSDEDDVVFDAQYKVVPPIPDSDRRQLQIACDSCGGLNPVSYENCQYCGSGLDSEKAAASINQRRDKAENSKRKVGYAALAADFATVVLVPEAAPVAVPVIHVISGMVNGHIDNQAAKESGDNPRYGKRDFVADTVQITGALTGDPGLAEVGRKAKTPMQKANRSGPIIP